MKDEFLSTVSHELRTPLTSIRSFSEILFDNPEIDIGDRSRFLAVIVKESECLTRMLNQILDLAKMEAGSIDWEMRQLDPRAAIEEALAVTSALFADKAARLEVRVGASLPQVYRSEEHTSERQSLMRHSYAVFCLKNKN